ncbi:hypothetical protein C488_16537 [Natrinema pellirubrum DSM 15624]|uniref:DUF192 domain-containing protein n=1 Tax=Natrinema pellirubrum (strain DSM 15624 / CIP 106293 / JCM 10476 / NCIMB 786 / 157) TaxID=797303 RepID=L0JQU6_NATP1|nr:DUF192 domain-containing protein [Natrinema pellirubrum]AGB33193.1 hypothetical protein Natpe_3409 [Natrinema pellirubrum DSM 15624]ELY71858.1 hypothetical protein C488_16537 [Natrinema pellirubrum DSM 15624]
MALESVWKGLLVIAAVLLVGVVLVQAGLVSVPWGPDEGQVQVHNESDGGNETELKAVVDVEIADDTRERRTGLSNHDSLERGNGMLFVHNGERDLTYVMREMDFDIDIIFIDADGEITQIHHARAPEPGEDGEELQYSGRGKWVLEVPRGYANETGIEVGDQVEIDLESNRTSIFDTVPADSLERQAAVADPDSVPAAAVGVRHVSVRR